MFLFKEPKGGVLHNPVTITRIDTNMEGLKILIDLYKFCIQNDVIGHAEQVLSMISSARPMYYMKEDK